MSQQKKIDCEGLEVPRPLLAPACVEEVVGFENQLGGTNFSPF